MFKFLCFTVFMMVVINNVLSYGPAESYQQSRLDSKVVGIAKLILQKPILAENEEEKVEYIAYPQYGFKYGVSDPKTGDNKEQREVRDGDVVKGEYSLIEPDGTKRIVKYTADKKNGFNAEVLRVGHAIHPQVVKVEKLVSLPARAYSLGLDKY